MVETWCGGLGCCSPEVERVSHGQPGRFLGILYEHQMIRKRITLTAAAGLSLSNITDLGIRPTPEYLHLWTLFPLKAERTC